MADERFAESVADRSLVIGVIGLGYVGLPLAIAFSEAGFSTVGFDVSEDAVAGLTSGVSHVEDWESSRLLSVISKGLFRPASDPSVLKQCGVVFICVPTPDDVHKIPDLSHVRSSSERLAPMLRPGALAVLPSTASPGTTTRVVQPILESAGLRLGTDFKLAVSPERVDPGNRQFTLSNTPKVVGGVDEESSDQARVLLESIMDQLGRITCVSPLAASEMAKLLENPYWAVDIAFLDELAMLCERIESDVLEVTATASTGPCGSQACGSGIDPDGHGIPVDSSYPSWEAGSCEFQTMITDLAAGKRADHWCCLSHQDAFVRFPRTALKSMIAPIEPPESRQIAMLR